MGTRGCRDEGEELLFDGYRVSGMQGANSSVSGWWTWLPNNMNVLNALTVHLTRVKMVNFMLHVSQHI